MQGHELDVGEVVELPKVVPGEPKLILADEHDLGDVTLVLHVAKGLDDLVTGAAARLAGAHAGQPGPLSPPPVRPQLREVPAAGADLRQLGHPGLAACHLSLRPAGDPAAAADHRPRAGGGRVDHRPLRAEDLVPVARFGG